MSQSKSVPITSSSKPAPEVAHSNALLNRNKKQTKYEAAVLARRADSEGWSDEKLTTALNDLATPESSAQTSTPVRSEGRSKGMDSAQTVSLKKREETIRIIRQAEMEGWSDDKLVAALRIRLSIGDELRARAQTL